MARDSKIPSLPARRMVLRAKAVPQDHPADASPMVTDGPEPRFLHSVLTQVSLPRSATDEKIFTRTSGKCSITLQAGVFFNGIRNVEQPLPFGCKPRLVLVHACSEAVRTRRREIEIGHSVRGFLRQLEIDCGGKEMAAFRRQMLALASTHMILGVPTEDGPKTIKAPPVETFNAWLVDDEGQSVAWPGVLELGERFFETLLEHAVPLDPRSISDLKNSALGLDVYAWLAHRLCRIKTNAGVMLSWGNLQQQFGSEYASQKDFKKRFLGALKKVTETYRDARIDQVRGGLRLYPSAPPIARRAVVVSLPAPSAPQAAKSVSVPSGSITDNTARKQLTAVVASTPTRAPMAAPQFVSEDALDKVRSVAPGWDRQWLLIRYQEWSHAKQAPANIDAAFLGWCRRFTKGKPPT